MWIGFCWATSQPEATEIDHFDSAKKLDVKNSENEYIYVTERLSGKIVFSRKIC